MYNYVSLLLFFVAYLFVFRFLLITTQCWQLFDVIFQVYAPNQCTRNLLVEVDDDVCNTFYVNMFQFLMSAHSLSLCLFLFHYLYTRVYMLRVCF